MLLFAIIVVVAVALDQISKVLIINWLSGVPGQSVSILKGILSFSYVKNTGVSFSFLRETPTILIIGIVSAILAAALIFFIKNRKRGPLFQVCMAFIIAGGIGNLIDRIFRTVEIGGVIKGYVVDFIELDFVHFAIFNVADCCVNIGAALLFIYVIKLSIDEAKQKKLLKYAADASDVSEPEKKPKRANRLKK